MGSTAEMRLGSEREGDEMPLPDDRCFALLCAPELQWRYEAVLLAAGRTARRFETVEALLAEGVQRPPTAILLDMNAVTRLGAMATAPLFELDVDWPILRCTLLPDGGANYMSLDPLRFGSLSDALGEIGAGDPLWLRPSRRRGTLRLDLACRVGVRRACETTWAQANCLNISVSGLFAVTYHPYSIGDSVELELRDLSDSRLRLYAEVARIRPWDAGAELPGIGVRFRPEAVTTEFKELLSRPEHIQRLIAGFGKRTSLPSETVVGRSASDRLGSGQPGPAGGRRSLLEPDLQTLADLPQ